MESREWNELENQNESFDLRIVWDGNIECIGIVQDVDIGEEVSEFIKRNSAMEDNDAPVVVLADGQPVIVVRRAGGTKVTVGDKVKSVVTMNMFSIDERFESANTFIVERERNDWE